MKLAQPKPKIPGQLSARYRRWLPLPRSLYRLITGLARDVLFIWVPKCAGTSIYSTLVQHGCLEKRWEDPLQPFDNRGMVTFGHVGIEQLVSAGIVTPGFLKRAFKFAFVRNPFDRAVSLYYYLKKIGCDAVPQSLTFEGFCEKLARGDYPPVGLYNYQGLNQCNPMVRWLKDANGRLTVDFVGRYETIEQDFRKLCGRIGLRSQLPRHNTTEHQPYRKYYNARTREIVEQVYREDLEQFGYSFFAGGRRSTPSFAMEPETKLAPNALIRRAA
jgi:hypothetical protein